MKLKTFNWLWLWVIIWIVICVIAIHLVIRWENEKGIIEKIESYENNDRRIQA
jgi:hypothetical protein